jgi:hypothetical protein
MDASIVEEAVSEASSVRAPLVRVIQAPYEGMIICRDHLGQIEPGVVAHEELPAMAISFWGHRCLMCIVDPSPGRMCESADCRRPLHPQWPAVYCCNDCALEDA